jgi:hypothetical protein
MTFIYLINIDARCGGVAPNTHVRFSLFGKPKLDAVEELGPRSMHSNQIQTSDIAHSNRNARSNLSSRGTCSCTKRDPNSLSIIPRKAVCWSSVDATTGAHTPAKACIAGIQPRISAKGPMEIRKREVSFDKWAKWAIQ